MKLADGREIQEVKYFDGIKWNSRIVRLFRVDKWLTIMKSENFKEDMQTRKNMVLDTDKNILTHNIAKLNFFSAGKIETLAIAGSVSEGTVVSSQQYRGYYLPVISGEKYIITRDALSNNRFEVGYSVEKPNVVGVEVSGGNITFRNKLVIDSIQIPPNYNYMFLYLSNQSDEIPNIEIRKVGEDHRIINLQNTIDIQQKSHYTIYDNCNSENIELSNLGDNLILTKLDNDYKKGAVIARSIFDDSEDKLLFNNIVTYKVWSGDEPIWDDTPVENSALEFTSLLGYQGVSTEPVDGYYLLNAGSYGGIFISTMQFEIGKSYKISFDYITTNNPGHIVITDPDVTRGTVYYGTNTSLNLVQDGQVNTKEIIIEATETKGHALGLMRSSNSGEVKIKADSIKVIEI